MRWWPDRRSSMALVALVAFAAVGLGVRAATRESPPPPSSSSSSSSASAPAAPPVGPVGRAGITVYDDGQPLAGRSVVFHGRDGRVLSSTTSGPDGKASGEVEEGGMITVAYGTSVRRLITFTSVEPGDAILVGEKDDDEANAGASVAEATVQLPGPHAGAARYGVSLGVGVTDVADSARAVAMPVLRRYVTRGNEFATLGLAFDAKGTALAYAFGWTKLGARGGDGGNDRDGGSAIATKLSAWREDWREHVVVLANAPNGLSTVDAALAIVAGEDRFECGRQQTRIAGGAATLHFRVPKPLGTTALVRLELGADAATGDKIVHFARPKAIALETRLDLATLLVPRVTNAKVERGSSLARPIVRWDEAGGASAKPTAAIVQLAWPETKEHLWTIVAPHLASASHRIEVPALPPSLASWAPDARPVAVAVALVAATEYGSWTDVETKGIHLLSEPPEDDDATVTIATTGGDLVF